MPQVNGVNKLKTGSNKAFPDSYRNNTKNVETHLVILSKNS